jgi:hypothetical protein
VGDDALVGRTRPKGRAERVGSKERECGPQGGCGPKCKQTTKTIFPIFQTMI